MEELAEQPDNDTNAARDIEAGVSTPPGQIEKEGVNSEGSAGSDGAGDN
jgi:hypothetical protein